MDFDLGLAQRAFRDDVRAFIGQRLPDEVRLRQGQRLILLDGWFYRAPAPLQQVFNVTMLGRRC